MTSSGEPKSTQHTMTSPRVPVIVVDDRKDVQTSSPPDHQHRNVPVVSSSSSSQQKGKSVTTISSSSKDYSVKTTSNSPSSSPCKTKSDSRNDNPATVTTINTNANNANSNNPKIAVHPSKPQITTRSSSDIGIPAASMPNLALYQTCLTGGGGEAGGGVGAEGGGSGCGESYLGVYCSPRTTRRSVDLDMKETVPGQYEWTESLDTSSNSLKVLTASSRVGSALSLNSECTTRSIGLLSNDSDSEEFSQSENKPSGQGQLRRFMSYPEEGQIPESNARPSQSLSNLKSANHSPSMSRGDRYLQRQSLDYADLGESTRTIIGGEEKDACERFQKECAGDLLKEENVDQRCKEDVAVGAESSSSSCSQNPIVENVVVNTESGREDGVVSIDSFGTGGKNRRLQQEGGSSSIGARTGTVAWKRGGVIGSVKNANNNNMLCYKCDTNSPSREGRVRQWLQDMDTTHADNDAIQ